MTVNRKSKTPKPPVALPRRLSLSEITEATPATTFTLSTLTIGAGLRLLDPAFMRTWMLARPHPLGVFSFLLHANWRHLLGNYVLLVPLATAYDVFVAMGGDQDPFLDNRGFTAYTLLSQAVGTVADLALNPLYREVPGAILVGSSSLIFSTIAMLSAGLWIRGHRFGALAVGVGGLALALLMDTTFPIHTIAYATSIVTVIAWLAAREAYRRGLLDRLLGRAGDKEFEDEFPAPVPDEQVQRGTAPGAVAVA